MASSSSPISLKLAIADLPLPGCAPRKKNNAKIIDDSYWVTWCDVKTDIVTFARSIRAQFVCCKNETIHDYRPCAQVVLLLENITEDDLVLHWNPIIEDEWDMVLEEINHVFKIPALQRIRVPYMCACNAGFCNSYAERFGSDVDIYTDEVLIAKRVKLEEIEVGAPGFVQAPHEKRQLLELPLSQIRPADTIHPQQWCEIESPVVRLENDVNAQLVCEIGDQDCRQISLKLTNLTDDFNKVEIKLGDCLSDYKRVNYLDVKSRNTLSCGLYPSEQATIPLWCACFVEKTTRKSRTPDSPEFRFENILIDKRCFKLSRFISD